MYASIYVYVLYVCLVPSEAEESIWSPGNGVKHNCKLWLGFWKTNLGPLQAQLVLLNCWAISPG